MTQRHGVRLLLIGIGMVCLAYPRTAAASIPHARTSMAAAAPDSLYRAARALLAQRDYRGAADLFGRIASNSPAADVAGNALYWRGYALYVAGNMTRRREDFRSAQAALDSESAHYPAASTAREGRDLRARVIAAQADLGDTVAVRLLVAAADALRQSLSCDDHDLTLELVALERVIDRDVEDARATAERVASTLGRCRDDVRRVVLVEVASTPGMSAATVMNDLARIDQGLAPAQASATSAVTLGAALPPVRPLGQVVATTTEPLRSITQIRPLSDGRVLVNDAAGKRVVLFDAALRNVVVVADTTSATGKAFSTQPGRPASAQGGVLLAYYGDSSLFTATASPTMLIIDPDGRVSRAIPTPTGARGGRGNSARIPFTQAVFDGQGHIVSKWPSAMVEATRGSAGAAVPVRSDTQPIVRTDIAAAKSDTVGWLQAPRSNTIALPTPLPGGRQGTEFTNSTNPLPVADGWTVLPDGTIAIVHVATYQIEWVARDGTRTSSPKIEHDWVGMSDSMKVAFVDSVRRVDSVAIARGPAPRSRAPNSCAGVGPAQTPTVVYRIDQATGVESPIPPHYVDPHTLPDHWPPFVAAENSVTADADGNVWICTNQLHPLGGGPVYDVVNRQGVLIDRVQTPSSTLIIGFGPGVVYLESRQGTGYYLSRARVR